MPEYMLDEANFDSPEWKEYKPGIKVAIRPLSNKKMAEAGDLLVLEDDTYGSVIAGVKNLQAAYMA